MALILGIESSCDETAAAVFCTEQSKILSSCLFSQIELHAKFGGVMPEVSSRSHVEKIDLIVYQALKEADVDLKDIDLIGVTTNPGLIGSLLVGVCFAKGLAWSTGCKIVGINHNHGHILSAMLDENGRIIENFPFPHFSISLSGGHTSIFKVDNPDDYKLLGSTVDDAAGEAFDKISKLLDLGYPGGPIIERLAEKAVFKDFYKYPRGGSKLGLDFSFSGLKTSILYHLVKLGVYDLKKGLKKEVLTEDVKMKVASSLLVCIKDIVIGKVKLALEKTPEIKAVCMVGGVACNRYLTNQLGKFCKEAGVKFYHPPRKFCTDNAAMIAVSASFKLAKNELSDLTLDVIRF